MRSSPANEVVRPRQRDPSSRPEPRSPGFCAPGFSGGPQDVDRGQPDLFVGVRGHRREIAEGLLDRTSSEQLDDLQRDRGPLILELAGQDIDIVRTDFSINSAAARACRVLRFIQELDGQGNRLRSAELQN